MKHPKHKWHQTYTDAELKAAMGNETVLVIDDEKRILEVSKGMLEELGFGIIFYKPPQFFLSRFYHLSV